MQNSNASFSRCVFSGNKVIGFAGGALYCNTVKYEEFLEKLGDAAFDDNFDNILKNKYLFRNAVIRISGCTFSGNEASGKTCYGSEASQSAKGGIAVMARFAGCDEVLEQLGKLRDSQKCDLAKGTGIRGGGAGGAIYVLQQRDGYLPLSVTIEGSSFTNDISLHDDPRLRAEIVIQNCRDVMLSGLDITATLPTAYKLVLENVVVRDATGVGVACSHGKLLSVDPRVRVAESTCK